MSEYSIPKPTLPAAARLLGAAVIIGLLGLGLVAFHVFSMVDNWLVAACFALVIELGAISEAIGILRKNRPAIIGAAVSLAVSASYNVTRVQSAGLALEGYQAWALAIGPLSAVLFLALSLSHELQLHETAVQEWQAARQAWIDARAAQQKADQEKRDQAARELEYQREKARIEADQAARLAEIAANERQAKREARIRKVEALAASRNQVETRVEPSTSLRGTSTPASRGDYAGFVELLRANHRTWKNAELAERFQVSERTITAWRAKYQAEQPQPIYSEN